MTLQLAPRREFNYAYDHDFPLAKLDIPAFQRGISENYIRSILAAFVEAAVGALVAAKTKGGRANLIDGHARLEVLLRLGYEHCPVILHPSSMTYDQQTQLYLTIDHRKKLTAYDQFKAGRELKQPDVMQIDAILFAHGREISEGRAHSVIRCIKATRDVYKMESAGEILDRCLGVLDYWIPGEPVYGDLLVGLARFLRQRRPEPERLEAILRSIPFDEAREEVGKKRIARNLPMGGGHDAGSWEKLFQEVFDRGKLRPDVEQELNRRLVEKVHAAAV